VRLELAAKRQSTALRAARQAACTFAERMRPNENKNASCNLFLPARRQFDVTLDKHFRRSTCSVELAMGLKRITWRSLVDAFAAGHDTY
jgi:hypothetical protein